LLAGNAEFDRRHFEFRTWFRHLSFGRRPIQNSEQKRERDCGLARRGDWFSDEIDYSVNAIAH
jgi:hypothetical protein